MGAACQVLYQVLYTHRLTSHNDFPTEGLLFHPRDAELLREGQEVAQILVRFGGRVGIQTPIFPTLTPLILLSQVKT